MASVLTNLAFDLYVRNGVRGGTPLSQGQFDDFWSSLSEPQKQNWQKLLAVGPSALTVEAIENIGVATLTESAIKRVRSQAVRK